MHNSLVGPMMLPGVHLPPVCPSDSCKTMLILQEADFILDIRAFRTSRENSIPNVAPENPSNRALAHEF